MDPNAHPLAPFARAVLERMRAEFEVYARADGGVLALDVRAPEGWYETAVADFGYARRAHPELAATVRRRVKDSAIPPDGVPFTANLRAAPRVVAPEGMYHSARFTGACDVCVALGLGEVPALTGAALYRVAASPRVEYAVLTASCELSTDVLHGAVERASALAAPCWHGDGDHPRVVVTVRPATGVDPAWVSLGLVRPYM